MSFSESIDKLIHRDRTGLLSVHPSWKRVRLADVATVLNGFPFSSASFSTTAGTPLIRIRDILGQGTAAYFDGPVDPAYFVDSGDFLVGMDGDFNSAIWRGPRGALNQRVCKITPDERHFSKRFLSFVLPAYLGAVNAATSSITVKHLSSRTVSDLPLPLPPRPEQDRIVQELESQFTRLDAAVAGMKRVQASLWQYRASVLKAACEGRLVPTEAELARREGRTYEPADQLLKRILAERQARWEADQVEKKRAAGKAPRDDDWKAGYELPEATREALPGVPSGWAWTTLRVVAELKGGLTKGQKRRADEKVRPVPYLRVANVQRGFLDLSEIKEIEATPAEIEELQLQADDILFNEGGDRDKLGRGWVWSGQIPVCIHQNHVFRARLFLGEVSAKFISWYGNSLGQAYMIGAGKQTTNLASINMTKLGSLPVPLPPAVEQSRIVAEVERRLSVVKELEATIDTNLARCARLRQSILKRAFEGKLVPQDPSDEPASALLDRIQKERGAATAPGRRVSRASRP